MSERPEVRIGTTIGPYEITASIGAGGMGEVFRARDPKLDRDVALKVLPARFAEDLNRRARFEREAKLLAALNHPNIAHIHGYVETASTSALVLELVEGMTLDQHIARGLAIAEVTSIATQIAAALDAAHERGIVHRDLKPSNIKITPEGSVKVLDFGIARVFQPPEESNAEATRTANVTAEGTVIGTAAYMSPEQARGLPIDKRSDIWSFGCVLFEMLTKTRAFSGSTTSDTIAAVLGTDPAWDRIPASTPPPLVALVRRCLEKDTRKRLRDIGDASLEMQQVARDAPAGRRQTVVAWTSSMIAMAAILALVVLLARQRPVPAAATDIPGAKLEQLTFDAGLTGMPAPSPDGKLLAYASDRSGRGDLDIWVSQISGGPPIRLTDDPADDLSPSFSPDGTQVAFRSERAGGGLYLVSALGGAARRISTEGYSPRFSPDGTKLAYWTGPWRGNAITNLAGQIFVLPLSGGAPVQIAPSFAVAREPVWSPDGKAIAFIGRERRDPGESSDVWWTPLTGGVPVKTGAVDDELRDSMILFGVSSTALGSWSPAGLLISSVSGVWALPIDGASGKLTKPAVQLTLGAGRYAWPAADAMGRISFASIDDPRAIERAPLNDDGQAELIFTDGQTGPSRPGQSRDGKRILYLKQGGGYCELWLKLAGEPDRFIVRLEVPATNAVISPDGTRAGYTLARGPGAGQGLVINLDGGVPAKLCDRCELWGFFSDNRRILALDETSQVLSVIDTVSGRSQEILRSQQNFGRTHLSPDDRWLAFGRGGDVFITAVTPGTPSVESSWLKIDQPTTTGRPAGWSMDSRTAYLLLDTDGFRCIWGQRVDPRTGALEGKPFAVRHFHHTVAQEFSTTFGNAVSEKGFIYGGGLLKGNLWRLTPK